MRADRSVSIGAPDHAEQRELLAVLAEAFRDNPMNRVIHGADPTRRVRANRAGLRPLVLRATDGVERRVLRVAGRIVGGFVVIEPHAIGALGGSMLDRIVALCHQGRRALAAWALVDEALARAQPMGPAWELAVLGVTPSEQGRGYGGRLLGALDALVASSPAPIHLACDRPASSTFYQRQGYRRREVVEVLGVRCDVLEKPSPSHPDGT